jgi:tRNA (cytidine/uridine-2'-O-)-methyltransferase
VLDDPPKTLSSRFQTLSQLQPVEPPKQRIYDQTNAYTTTGGCRRRDTAGAERPAFPPNRAEQAVQNRSIGTLAERAQARYRLASVQCTNSTQSDDLFRDFMEDREGRHAMQIALFQPDIPQNTGTILRLCACLDVPAHIIEPAGFPTSDRHFRRAGMDYLDRVSIMRHDSWSKFEHWRNESGYRLILFTTRGSSSYLDYRYGEADILLFGRESAGVPEEVFGAADARLVIPIMPSLRSMNVAMAAAMAMGEALRQIRSTVKEAAR